MTARFLTTAAMLSALTAIAPALYAQPAAGSRLLAKGHTLYAEQRFAEAVVAYRAALAADGSLAEAHY